MGSGRRPQAPVPLGRRARHCRARERGPARVRDRPGGRLPAQRLAHRLLRHDRRCVGVDRERLPGRGPDSRRSRTRSIPKSSSAPSTRCFAAARGPRGPVRCATRSATGTTPFAARSSAASGAPVTRRLLARESVADPRMLAEVAARPGGTPEGAVAQVLLRPARLRALRGDHPARRSTIRPGPSGGCWRRGCRSLIRRLGTRSLVELGAGSAEKSRIILDAMRGAGTAELYVPIDVSATFLSQTAARLRRGVSRTAGRAGDRRHLRGAQPPAADAASGALRLPRQHHRQLLSAGGDPAAEPGAERAWSRATGS